MPLHFLGTPARLHLWKLAEPNSNEAKNLRTRLLSGPTVDIYVGPERKYWSLPQNLLCHYSSYFDYELRGYEVPKRNNAAGALELPDDDPRGFALLVKWLYQGRLDDTTNLNDEEKYEYAIACHKLHRLSYRFHLPALKNLAIDAYRSNLHSARLVPDAEEINEIYRSESRGSPFRTLMVRIAARQIMDPEVGRDAEAYRGCFEGNAEFAVELVNAIRVMSGGMLLEDPTEGNDCVWHDHEDGEACAEMGKVVVLLDGGGRGMSKTRRPHSRRIQPPLTPVKDINDLSTPARPNETPSPSLQETTAAFSARANPQETPGPPNLTPNPTPRPSNTKAKPRKLERTPAKPTTPSTNITATANESRKLTPKLPSRVSANANSNAVKAKLSQINDQSTTITKPAVAATPTRALPRVNNVNGIVRQFNSLNWHSTLSEASTSGSVGKRKPVKLKYKTGG